MRAFVLSLRRYPGESELAKWIRRAKYEDFVLPFAGGVLLVVAALVFAFLPLILVVGQRVTA